MSALTVAVGLSLLGSLGGVLRRVDAAALQGPTCGKLVPWLVSYAVGTLLGVALMDLLPESLEVAEAPAVFGTLLGGILVFFVFEKLVLWRHCHADHCEVHETAAPLILVGDAVHNFIDGAVIAAATCVLGAARRDDAARGRHTRNPAGGRRLRHSARRRVHPAQRPVAQRVVGPVGRRRRAAGGPRGRPRPAPAPYFLPVAAAQLPLRRDVETSSRVSTAGRSSAARSARCSSSAQASPQSCCSSLQRRRCNNPPGRPV